MDFIDAKTIDDPKMVIYRKAFTLACDIGSDLPEKRAESERRLRALLSNPSTVAYVKERLAYEKCKLDDTPYIGGAERATWRGLVALEKFLLEEEGRKHETI